MSSQKTLILKLKQPKVEEHPTWLHLRIRELEPSKAKGDRSADGRWTLGFTSGAACEAARVAIVDEISKQRCSVRCVLAPLLDDHFDAHSSKVEDLSIT